MKALNLIEPSLNETISFFSKLDAGGWVIMGLINLFSQGGGRITSPSSRLNLSDLPFQPIQFLKKWWWALLLFGSLGAVFGLLFTFISWLFTFLLYSIIEKKEINFNLIKQKNSAFQMLLFNVIIVFLNILVISFFGWGLYMLKNYNPNNILIAVVLAMPFLFFIVFLFMLINFLASNFVVPDIFVRKTSLWNSLKKIASALAENPWEVLIFLFAKTILGWVIGILFTLLILFLFLLYMMAISVVAFPFAAILLGILYFSNMPLLLTLLPFSIAAVPLLFIFALFSLSLASTISFFLTNYTLNFYKAVLKPVCMKA